MKTSNEVLQELIRLKSENPDAQVILCIDNEETLDPSQFRYVFHDFYRVEMGYIWADRDDTVHTDRDDILRHLQYELEDYPEYYKETSPEELFENVAKKAIIVYTAPTPI